MSLFNVFSKKKPTYQTQNQTMSSQPIQGSGYGSNYANNASNYKAPQQPAVKASTYSTPNYLSNLTKQPAIQTRQPTQSVAPKQPAPTPYKPPQTLPWGTNKGAMPWGTNQPSFSGAKPLPNMSVAPKPNMSVAPRQNMSVDPNAGRYKAPAPIPQPQPQPQPQVDPNSEWMNYVANAANRQAGFAEQQRDDNMNFLRQQGELTNQQLLSQLPVARENFDQYKSNTEASIADLLAGGERQKSQASDYYGDAQRQAAQTLRETQGDTQKTFAALGTLDSRGEGSFAQANENTMSEFNRYTQQNLKAKADQLTEIDATVAAAERNARATITQEEQKMRQLERDIQFAVANNDLTTAQGLKEAYSQSQQYIYDIQDSFAQTQYQFGLEQQKLQNELAKMQSFTPEFMATGQPTNQAEYEYYIKNKDAMESVYGGSSGNESKQKVNKIISDLMGMSTSGITGKMRYGYSNESRAAEGLLKQLSSELQIEEAKRLKGQGAMSDSERAILANSIAAFNLDENGRPNISDDRFRQVLEELKSGIGGQTSGVDINTLLQQYGG